jgi:pimeloyl-ACP methyl ester carboxylesterase
MAATGTTNAKVKPFTIDIPQSVLDDLQERLRRTRFPDEAPLSGWTMGTNLSYMKKLADYWQKGYDWRAQEAKLNQLHHFKADVKGIDVHFVHERGQGANTTPILLLHGWPDSFYRFHKLIPLLAAANPSFDVVAPSLPGFGFSERKSMDHDEAASLMVELMTGVLGYEKFFVLGGDLGSSVTMTMAQSHPDVLLGIYTTEVGYPDQNTDFASLSPKEMEFAQFIQQWWMAEGAYNMVQSTKPQSLGFAMNDSPVGLAAWIMSFMTIGTTGEEIEQRLGRDEILTNIMIAWLTETAASSFRWYYESAHANPQGEEQGDPAEKLSKVPAAVAHAPDDAPLPREWAERKLNVQHFTDYKRGGHYAVWEDAKMVADDLIDFVRQRSR